MFLSWANSLKYGIIFVFSQELGVTIKSIWSSETVTPEPVTLEPVTPEPVKPKPVTPVPVTPEPFTPEPVTPGPKPGASSAASGVFSSPFPILGTYLLLRGF